MQGLVRRPARLLALSWGIAWASVPISVAFGSIIVQRLSGDARLAGLPYFLLGAASAVAAYPAGRLMDRHGRRPVLVAGHLLAALGFAIGTVSIAVGSFAGFLVGHVIGAFGAGTTYLTRLAAADLYPSQERGRGLGRLVFFLALGAVAGYPLTRIAVALAPALGLTYLAVAWGVVPLLTLTAAVLVSFVRPDPREIALAIQGEESLRGAATDAAGSVPQWPWRALATAGATLVFAQSAMATIMAVAGIGLDHLGHAPDFIVAAMIAHIIGMFLFSPWIGRLGDRWGRRTLLRTGAAVLVLANLLLLAEPGALVLTLGIVGVGWSFAFIGTTALVADRVGAVRRGRATGTLDLLTGVAAALAALAGLAAGGAFGTGGIPATGVMGLVLSLGSLVAALLCPPRSLRLPGTAPEAAPAPAT